MLASMLGIFIGHYNAFLAHLIEIVRCEIGEPLGGCKCVMCLCIAFYDDCVVCMCSGACACICFCGIGTCLRICIVYIRTYIYTFVYI